MSKKGTWIEVGKGYMSVNHGGNSIEVLPGVDDREGADLLKIDALKKYANHPVYSFPGNMAFNAERSEPLPPLGNVNTVISPPKSEPVNSNRVLIKHSYDSQRDNYYKPGSACAPTSMSMVCNAYNIAVPNGGEDSATWIYKTLERKYGQRIAGTVGCMKALLEKEFGFKDTVVWNLTPDQYMKHIKNNGVVILHTKGGSMTRSGHVIPLFGYELKAKSNGGHDSVIASDPWGVCMRGTLTYKKVSGYNVRYSFNWMFSHRNLLAAHLLTHPSKNVQYV